MRKNELAFLPIKIKSACLAESIWNGSIPFTFNKMIMIAENVMVSPIDFKILLVLKNEDKTRNKTGINKAIDK